MFKPLLLVVKLIIVLIVSFFLSYTKHIPIILYGILVWYIWLWVVAKKWKKSVCVPLQA